MVSCVPGFKLGDRRAGTLRRQIIQPSVTSSLHPTVYLPWWLNEHCDS